jgi:hypothetical protein
MAEIKSKNSLYPHRQFTEYLVGAFRKSPQGERFEPRILESFDPVTQEQYRVFTFNNPHTIEKLDLEVKQSDSHERKRHPEPELRRAHASTPGR